MIVVLGSVAVRDGELQRALASSRQHVGRSRAEPGCVSHAVYVDAEQPLRLQFVEEWVDRAALQRHFEVPASRAFVKELAGLAAEPPKMAVYDATPLRV